MSDTQPRIKFDYLVGNRAYFKVVDLRQQWVKGLSRWLHVLHFVDFSHPGADAYDLPEDAPEEQVRAARAARAPIFDAIVANVFSSKIAVEDGSTRDEEDQLHTVAVDIDFPALVVASSTEGHSHLFIDKPMPWRDYKKLLRVMAEVGLVEEGYVGASERRGATHLRLPWCHKEDMA